MFGQTVMSCLRFAPIFSLLLFVQQNLKKKSEKWRQGARGVDEMACKRRLRKRRGVGRGKVLFWVSFDAIVVVSIHGFALLHAN